MKTRVRKGSGAVRLSIPARVAYNADAFKKSIYDLLNEIGCPKCFSGVDCYFSTVRDYVLDPKQGVISQFNDPNPQPSKLGAQSTLNVSVSAKTSFEIDKIDLAIKNIFDEIGCMACCSGHDIYFQNNFDFNI